MNILISGGSGLVGTELLNQSKTYDGMDFYSIGRTRPAGVTDHITDSMTGVDLPAMDNVDTVLHLVQSDEFRNLPNGLGNVTAVNTLSTARLLEWAVTTGVRRFVLASSGAVYQHPERRILADDSTINPYAATRRAAELIANAMSSAIEVVVLRYFFIYGPNQDRRMLLPRIADRVKAGEPIVLDGRDGLAINPIHVSDAARLTLGAVECPTGTYDVCGPAVVTLSEIAQWCGEYLGCEPKFQWSDRPAGRMVAPYRPELLGEALVEPRAGLRDICTRSDE